MVFRHVEVNLRRRGVYHRAKLTGTRDGIVSCKPFVEGSYQGTRIPAGRNCPSIAPISRAKHSEARTPSAPPVKGTWRVDEVSRQGGQRCPRGTKTSF